MWRNDFPIFSNYEKTHGKRLVYLDNAATSMKTKSVIDSMSYFMEHSYGSVHRGAYKLSVEASQQYEKARARVAKFVGSGVLPEQVIFTRGTTESLNLLASGIQKNVLGENSRIVSTEAEHHANLIPWQQAALNADCEIAYVPLVNSEKGWMLSLEKASKLVSQNTKVFTFAHVGNALGQVNAVHDFIQLAKNVDAFAIVDCAQSAATHDVDFLGAGADAVVFSGHKLFGPTGIGVLVASKRLLSILPPFQFGGSMVSSVTLEGAQWAEGAAKFEAGTPPLVEAIGLQRALDWIDSAQREKLLPFVCELNAHFVSELKKIPEIELFLGAPIDSQHISETCITAFRHKTIHAHDLATILDSHHVAVRAGHHCAWPLVQKLGVDALVRASFGPHCSHADVEIAVGSIKQASSFLL